MTTRQQLLNLRERVSQLKAERAYWQNLAEERRGRIEQLEARCERLSADLLAATEPRFGKCGVRPGVRPWHNKRPGRKP